MFIKLHSLVFYLSTGHCAHACLFCVWTKRQSQGRGSGFANWSLTSGVQAFSCMDGDQEERSEERPEGIQVAHRPPGSHHLAFPHQQLARIRKKSPECGIDKGLVEEGA